jgi:hypothetical protein
VETRKQMPGAMAGHSLEFFASHQSDAAMRCVA